MMSETNEASVQSVVLPSEIDGTGPDGKPAKFTFAEGRWFANVCPDCKESNGMGVVNEQHLIEHYESDPYAPCNKPCLWCGKGPMVRQFLDR
jgi:hypothetical protein